MAVKRATTSRRSGSTTSKAKSAKRPAPRKTVKAAAKAPAKRVAAPVRKTSVRKAPVRKKTAPPTRKAAAAAPAPVKRVKSAAIGSVNAVLKVVEGALDEMKAVQVKVLDVRKLTDIADTLIIASGNSDRHVRSIADRVVEHAKKAGFRPTGIEGQRDGEWVLVDLQDVIVHIMLPRVREIYRLENLWDVSAARREAAMEKRAV